MILLKSICVINYYSFWLSWQALGLAAIEVGRRPLRGQLQCPLSQGAETAEVSGFQGISLGESYLLFASGMKLVF